MTEELLFSSATELAARIRDKRLSPVALVRAYLERIDRLDGTLHAYITVTRDAALGEADACEQAVARGATLGPLHGVPIAVKDQIDAAGIRTTAGSRLLRDNVATRDAPVIARLRAAGAILLGKLNLTEFALGGTQQFPYGQPRNPWNVEHDPGGSSSGSGIAAAAALAAATLGEDTGGSIRSPASNCGAVGHRPTWGLVPRAGCIPLCHTMDAIGPITRTVEDAALLLSIIAGPDPGDPLMRQAPPADVMARLRDGVGGLRVGVVRELATSEDTNRETRAAVAAAAETFAKLGAKVVEVSLPLISLAGAVFMALADSEGAGQHLPWLRTRADEYDAATRRRLIAASLLPTGAYHQATRARALITRQVLDVMQHVDLLLAPTQPGPATKIASGQAPVASKEDAAKRFFTRRSYTTPFNLAAMPAISLPCGFAGNGLPIGLQLAGRRYDDATVLRAAWAYEQATPWHERKPAAL
jgi:aspartyl-tRNA(Asn)/glutamyl-tRNA(Gln) amidotransferase subunit A